MKKILITYHMGKLRETAESCILVPMTARNARSIIEQGKQSYLVAQPQGAVRKLLEAVTQMQGYDPEKTEFIMAERP